MNQGPIFDDSNQVDLNESDVIIENDLGDEGWSQRLRVEPREWSVDIPNGLPKELLAELQELVAEEQARLEAEKANDDLGATVEYNIVDDLGGRIQTAEPEGTVLKETSTVEPEGTILKETSTLKSEKPGQSSIDSIEHDDVTTIDEVMQQTVLGTKVSAPPVQLPHDEVEELVYNTRELQAIKEEIRESSAIETGEMRKVLADLGSAEDSERNIPEGEIREAIPSSELQGFWNKLTNNTPAPREGSLPDYVNDDSPHLPKGPVEPQEKLPDFVDASSKPNVQGTPIQGNRNPVQVPRPTPLLHKKQAANKPVVDPQSRDSSRFGLRPAPKNKPAPANQFVASQPTRNRPPLPPPPQREGVIMVRGPVDELFIKSRHVSKRSRFPARFSNPNPIQMIILGLIGLVGGGQLAVRMYQVIQSFLPIQSFIPQYKFYDAATFLISGAVTTVIAILLLWTLTNFKYVFQYIATVVVLFIIFPIIVYSGQVNLFSSVVHPTIGELFTPSQWDGAAIYFIITAGLLGGLIFAVIDRIILLVK